jgi:hypothetical protein
MSLFACQFRGVYCAVECLPSELVQVVIRYLLGRSWSAVASDPEALITSEGQVGSLCKCQTGFNILMSEQPLDALSSGCEVLVVPNPGTTIVNWWFILGVVDPETWHTREDARSELVRLCWNHNLTDGKSIYIGKTYALVARSLNKPAFGDQLHLRWDTRQRTISFSAGNVSVGDTVVHARNFPSWILFVAGCAITATLSDL